MKEKVNNNISLILSIFLLLEPVLDLLTGYCLHTLKINLTVGIIIRVLFLFFILYLTIFIYKKKELRIPYLIILLYSIIYILGIFLYKGGSNLFIEIQGLIKVLYFPIILISLYTLKDSIRISKLTYLTTLFLYLIFIFVPTTLGMGYKTYEITKVGTLGFFNSANEISGIIGILTPYLFIILITTKKLIPKIGLLLIYLVVILMMGTKTPLLILLLTLGLSLIYYWIKEIKKKEYKKVSISIAILLLGLLSMIIIIPRTNFYKNIKTHLDFLEVNSILEVFQKEELIDHFIFSQRLTFLNNKAKIYNKSNLYQKLFGIGYINNNKKTKMIEMDHYDIYYSHGLIGFIIVFMTLIYVLRKILKKKEDITYSSYMEKISIFWILFLSFFTGHIITSPSVSYLSVLLIISLYKNKKVVIIGTCYKENIRVIKEEQVEKLKNKFNYLFFKIINFKNYDISYIYKLDDDFTKEIAEMISLETKYIKTEKELEKIKE